MTVTDPAAVTSRAVRQLCDQLAASGRRTVRTGPLDPACAAVFLEAGFVVVEDLVVLVLPLGRGRVHAGDRVVRPEHPTRRARRRAVLDLEARVFGAEALDPVALADALAATPAVRFRVVGRPRAPHGYAITGVAGTWGYVQRLAVDPGARGRGIGRALVADGLRWASRHGAHTACVNTTVPNAPARALYESLGFVALPEGLRVVERGPR